MALKPLALLVIAVACSVTNPTSAVRELNLAARLEAQGGLMECWDALWEIKSCSNEIILFFTNGSTDIGPACCKSINTITHNCWPAMLSSIGFTVEETDILGGYCDASSSSPPTSAGPAVGPVVAARSNVMA